VALQPDGKILVAGCNRLDAVVARDNAANGSLDSSFGANGAAVAVAGPSTRRPWPSRRTAGSSWRVWRAKRRRRHRLRNPLPGHRPAGRLVHDQPDPVTAGSSVTLTAANVVPLNPGTTVTQVAFYLDSNNDGTLEPGSDVLLGYATLGGNGTWTLTVSTAGLAPGTYTLFARAKDSDDAFSDPIALTLVVQ
jgi:hypothetical protein